MRRMPRIMPVTDFRSDAAGALKAVRESKEPVVITQRGRAAAVIVSLEAYERDQEERRILLQLARGEKEIAEGKGFDLESVLDEAEELLKGDEL